MSASSTSKPAPAGRVFFPESFNQSANKSATAGTQPTFVSSGSTLRPSRVDLQRYETTYGFNEHRIALFVESFSVFDKNGDGLVTSNELSNVCSALGYRLTSRQHLDQLIRTVDPDNKDAISFDKFVALMARQQMNGSSCDDIDDVELRQVFDVFDFNADGLITADELAEVLSRLGESMSREEIQEMIKEADTNGDGAVDYKEFKHILHVK